MVSKPRNLIWECADQARRQRALAEQADAEGRHDRAEIMREMAASNDRLAELLPLRITLSPEGVAAFEDAMENPPEPSEQLRDLFRKEAS